MATPSIIQNRPISVILDGSNYVLWCHYMTIHLKSKGLYSYATGVTKAPTKETDETDVDLAKRVDDWDMKNAQILGFINCSTTTEIHLQLLGYTTAKEVWDFLAKRFITAGLSHQYQLWSEFQRKRQLPDQTIGSYVSEMQVIRDQLNLGTPQIFDDTADQFRAYFDQLHLITLLMGLSDKFEHVRASLLHRHPFPTYNDAVSELLSEETRLQSGSMTPNDAVFHTSTNNYRNKYSNFKPENRAPAKECSFCHSSSHSLLDCPIRTCPFCKITHPKHYMSDCSKNPRRPGFQRRYPNSKPMVGPMISETPKSASSPSMPTTPNVDLLELMRKNQEMIEQLMVGSMGTNDMLSTSGPKEQGDPWSRP